MDEGKPGGRVFLRNVIGSITPFSEIDNRGVHFCFSAFKCRDSPSKVTVSVIAPQLFGALNWFLAEKPT